MKPPIEEDPRPHKTSGWSSSLAWPVRRVFNCPPIISPPKENFEVILQGRRSNPPVLRAPIREVINCIAFATEPSFILHKDKFERKKRPSMSAGALHSVHILIVDWRGYARVMWYSEKHHQVSVLSLSDETKLQEFKIKTESITSCDTGTTIVFLGDYAKISAVYKNPKSLLWRDAGALLQTLHLCATSFRLAFCPIGILGNELVQAFNMDDSVIGLGAATIGRYSD